MIVELLRNIERREDRIPLKLVNDAAILLYGLGNSGELVIESSNQLNRGQRLADSGKALQIHEKYRRLAHFTTAHPNLVFGSGYLFYDLGRRRWRHNRTNVAGVGRGRAVIGRS